MTKDRCWICGRTKEEAVRDYRAQMLKYASRDEAEKLIEEYTQLGGILARRNKRELPPSCFVCSLLVEALARPAAWEVVDQQERMMRKHGVIALLSLEDLRPEDEQGEQPSTESNQE